MIKFFIMETYDSECYIITVKDIISNRTILEGEIISAQGESDYYYVYSTR
jgi:hypothetical protein